jgi:predicted NBD/HSP70 family sugar kinase
VVKETVSVRSQFKGASAVETHGAILDLIRSNGVISRTELTDRSGLTGASISRIVRQLLDDGLVVETGLGESTGGKRRTLIQLNPASRFAVGITLEYDQITYVVVDLGGRVVTQRYSKGAGQRPPYKVAERIGAEANALLESTGLDSRLVAGIGIAIAGRRGLRDQKHSTTRVTDWEYFALEETLGAATGRPVIVENDSTCAAMGEYWVGRRPATEDLAALYMTEGFGFGLVLKGEIYRGTSANAGEIGHITVDPNGPECTCGRRGCLQAMGGMERTVGLALRDKRLTADHHLRGTRRTLHGDYAKIARAATAGDARAFELIEQSAEYLATTLVSITNLLDLDQIILAGPGFGLVGQIYADAAAAHLSRDAWARPVHTVRVGLSSMGSDVAALGAASLVLHSQLLPHLQSGRPEAVSR